MAGEGRNPNRRPFQAMECFHTLYGDLGPTGGHSGTISDISFDGALIRTECAPVEGIAVAVRFAFRDQGVHLQGRVTSEVIHAEGEGDEPTFGVKFETSMEKFWTQLTPMIQTLLEETDEDREDMADKT